MEVVVSLLVAAVLLGLLSLGYLRQWRELDRQAADPCGPVLLRPAERRAVAQLERAGGTADHARTWGYLRVDRDTTSFD